MDPLIDRAALGVTELLSNVHRHARPDKSCTVELELLPDRLTVSVRDHDPRLPVPADATETKDTTPLATCGRGLAMVAAVSESWGARPDGENGKVVWFTLPAPATTRAHPPGSLRGAVRGAPTPAAGAAPMPVPAKATAPVRATAPAKATAPADAAVPAGVGAPAEAAVPAGVGAPAEAAVRAGLPAGTSGSAEPAVAPAGHVPPRAAPLTSPAPPPLRRTAPAERTAPVAAAPAPAVGSAPTPAGTPAPARPAVRG